MVNIDLIINIVKLFYPQIIIGLIGFLAIEKLYFMDKIKKTTKSQRMKKIRLENEQLEKKEFLIRLRREVKGKIDLID